MLSYEAELRDHARRLFEDVGPLCTISLLGFDEDEKPRVDECLTALQNGPWVFLDLRGAGDEAAKNALRPHLGDEALVIVARNNKLARPLINYVRACIDRSPRFDFGDYVTEERLREQSVVLVVEGASTHEALPGELARIPYEDLIP